MLNLLLQHALRDLLSPLNQKGPFFPVSALLVCWLSSAGIAVFGQDTLPSVTEGSGPQSFSELWRDFDPRADALEEEILHEWEEDQVKMRVLRYCVGQFKGKNARVAAIYGYPIGAKQVPGLVQIHGGGQYADHRAVLTNAKRGYATISVSWAGRISAPNYRVSPAEVKLFWDNQSDDPNYRVTTDWGALDGYHAPSRFEGNAFPIIPSPAPWTLDAVESPRNNSWFLATLAARRALTFLERQPEVDPDRLGVYGHSMGGKLTVLTAGIDRRVKAAVPSCGGVSDRYNKKPLFQATLGDVPYLERIDCPIAFLSPANDFHGRIHDLQLALRDIQSTDWRVICSAHHNHQDNASNEVATQLWFDQHLKQAFTWPKTPETLLQLDSPSHTPTLTVRPDLAMPVLAVEVYYTQDADPETDHEGIINRFWHYAPTTKDNGDWIASLPLTTLNQPLWAFANVIYDLEEPVTGAGYYYRVYTANQFVLSSPLSTVHPDQLRAARLEPTLKATPIIETFAGDWQKNWFTYRPDEWARRTHKVNDPTWAPPSNARLSIQVRSKEPNQLVVGADDYAAVISLAASDDWQSFTLKAEDFADARGDKRASFDGVMELRLASEETLRARRPDANRKVGSRWKGPEPEFSELKWEKP